uniref:Protein kinase domain-containing protein n=1 Tax=Amphilophus citrinellus TaxID=61819 RepID=A0A3Q0T8Y7_AMPCI
MDKYTVLHQIGKGAYGSVYKVACRNTGKCLAMKCHNNEGTSVSESTVRELSCLFSLKGHPYVVDILDCFVSEGRIATIMTYHPYTLQRLIYNGRGCPRSTPLSFVASFSVQIANALSYMHGLNIIHRDLAPPNVLLTDDLVVKVADMGLSRNAVKWMSSTVVTEPYRAPELFVKDVTAQYTCAIDMWSLGVLIADAMEGKPVFLSKNVKGSKVSTYEVILKTVGPPELSDCKPAKAIISRLLTFSRVIRMQILQCAWLRVRHRNNLVCIGSSCVLHQMKVI